MVEHLKRIEKLERTVNTLSSMVNWDKVIIREGGFLTSLLHFFPHTPIEIPHTPIEIILFLFVVFNSRSFPSSERVTHKTSVKNRWKA